MLKTFRPWAPGQTSLLPASPSDWLSADHQVYVLLDLAFRVLTGNQQPDHSQISEFRHRNLGALSELFVQILRLCQEAGPAW